MEWNIAIMNGTEWKYMAGDQKICTNERMLIMSLLQFHCSHLIKKFLFFGGNTAFLSQRQCSHSPFLRTLLIGDLIQPKSSGFKIEYLWFFFQSNKMGHSLLLRILNIPMQSC